MIPTNKGAYEEKKAKNDLYRDQVAEKPGTDTEDFEKWMRLMSKRGSRPDNLGGLKMKPTCV